MKRLSILFISLLALTSCSEAQVKSDNTSKETTSSINKVVSAEEFKDMTTKEGVQLIDVRTPEEYTAGKIGNATNINFYDADFEAKIAKLDKTKPVLVYCAAGGRSGKAAQIMNDLGFSEVYDLSGGYGRYPYKQ